MVKPTMVCLYQEILFSNEKKPTITLMMILKDVIPSEKSQLQMAMHAS